MKFFLAIILTVLESGTCQSAGAAALSSNTASGSLASPWADFVETDFPYFSSVLDARGLGDGWPADNLTPRGLILNLGHQAWACFDVDLLRMSVIWKGAGISPVSMAQGSYHIAGWKAPPGQENLPKVLGSPLLANGIYAGWQAGIEISLSDPREPGADPREIGRGPLPASQGRFGAVQLTGGTAILEYEAGGVSVRERVEASGGENGLVVKRGFQLKKNAAPLWLIVGKSAALTKTKITLIVDRTVPEGVVEKVDGKGDGLVAIRVRASATPIEFQVILGSEDPPKFSSPPDQKPIVPSVERWPEILTTRGVLSESKLAFVLDDIPLPVPNPWLRNVRLADIAFFRDGRAAAVTFDGDVWLISGLAGELHGVRWKRFAAGLHEPLGLAIRDEELFVFDRNGIWRLRDTDGNGEADRQELFSNIFTQTAETREFASGIRVGPDGSFFIAKGGQQSTTLGRHNGSVLRIGANGNSATVVGWGLRQPFLGVHPKTGLVTASDQQGHYVPATPLHIIRDHQYYGFLSELLPEGKYPAPIADPLLWIPHPINASGAGQVWLEGAKMGPLNGALIHLGYYRPEAFFVLLHNHASRLQGAVVSLTQDFQFPALEGAVNPVDGQLYITGFQIWGTTAKRISGLARLRYTGAASLFPREIVPMNQGVLLRFDVPLNATMAKDAGNFSAERWVYRRTPNYGSPHFKPDGSKGQEAMTPSSAYLSRDGKGVFVGIPNMKPVMQMRMGWSLAARGGDSFTQNAYLTPYELVDFQPAAEGFESLTVDLTSKNKRAEANTPVNAAEGKRLAELMGCAACHSVDGSLLGKVGPSWKGLFASERTFADGSKGVADEAYLRQSIREPTAKVVRGFDKSDTGMPSYEGVMTDAQMEAVILYIKTVR